MTAPAAPAEPTPQMDPDRLNALLGRVIGDLGATIAAGSVVVGHRLGLYRALAQGPATPEELAGRTGTDPRYVAEWLAGQAAGGYVEYDPADRRFRMTPEQAFALADPDGPLYVPGAFVLALGALRAEPRITEAFRTGRASPGTSTTRTCSSAASCSSGPATSRTWSRAGSPRSTASRPSCAPARGSADVGCGLGASSVLLAQAYPQARIVGVGLPRRLDRAGPQARGRRGGGRPGELRGRLGPDVPGPRLRPGRPRFDCLHDMGDPLGAARHIRAALAPDGTWMIVEPRGGRPGRGQPQPHRAGLLASRRSSACRTRSPSPAATPRGPGGGGRDPAGRHRRRVHPVPAGGGDPVQPRLRGPPVGGECGRGEPDDARRRSSATACRVGYEVFEPLLGDTGTGAADAAAADLVGDRPHAPVEAAGAGPRAALPGGDRRGPGQRAPRPADRPGAPTPTRSTSPTPSRSWTPPASTGRCSSGCRWAPATRCSSRPLTRPRRRRGRGRAHDARRAAEHRRGSTQVGDASECREKANRTTGGSTTADGSSSSVARMFPEPHSTKQLEDGVGWALRDRRRDPRRDVGRPGSPARPTADAEAVCRAVRCPVLVVHGDRDEIVPCDAAGPGGGVDRRHAGHRARRGGHGMPVRDPVRFTLLVAGSPSPSPPPAPVRRILDARSRPAPSRAVRLLRDRARPRPARRRDRRGAARPPPGPADRLAGPAPRDRGARGPRASGCTRRAGSSRARARTSRASRGSGASTTCTPSGDADMDEILAANFHVFHDVVEDEAARPGGRATRAGRSTTSCTRTPSSSGPPTPG